MNLMKPWGAVLPTQVWMGFDSTSDQSPSDGAGGVVRWATDIEALAAVGIDSVRIGVDWSRVMPSPGRIHDGWIEWYRGVATCAADHGVTVWWCLLERGLPGWFADEGGFADQRFAARWWPRWVETAADHLGDLAGGWVPIDDPAGVARRAGRDDPTRMSESLPTTAQAWRDAWRQLRGPVPVASCLRVGTVRPRDHTVPALEEAREQDHLMWGLWLQAWRTGVVELPGRSGAELDDLAGSLDVMGLWINAADASSANEVEDLVMTVLERGGEQGPQRPLHLSVRPGQPDPDRAADTMNVVATAIRRARRDGVGVERAWLAPGIAGPGAPDGLLDPGRQPNPVAEILAQDRPR